MSDHRTTSSAWMRGVANTMRAQGLDAAELFAEIGLSIADLDDPDYRWPTEQASRLWTLATERSGNPDIGLSNPHLPRPDQYGIVGYAMMSSPDLLAGLRRLIRYICLVSDAVTITLEPGAGGRWMRLELYGGECPNSPPALRLRHIDVAYAVPMDARPATKPAGCVFRPLHSDVDCGL